MRAAVIPPARRARRLCLATVVALAGSGAVADGEPPGRTVSGCAGGQQVVFACSTGAGRQVAVCSSPDLSPTAGSMQLRFLRRGKLVLELPAHADAATAWRDQVKAGRVMYAGGGGAYLRFEAAGQAHVVYSAIGRGWGTKAGALVLAPGGTQTVQKCQGPVRSQIGPALAERAGVGPDPEDLELPAP